MPTGGDAAMPNRPDTLMSHVREDAVLGLLCSFFTLVLCLFVSLFTSQWLWLIAAVPATVVLAVVIGLIGRLASRSAKLTRIGHSTALARSAQAILLLVGLATAVGLIWVGIAVNRNAAPCDPQVSHCVLVVNGVARGTSDQSVGSQRFSTFLVSLIAIGPALVILYYVVRGGRNLIRALLSR
jgi:uncharacterized membrane protein YraQ (UPF0718 family)